MADMTDEKTEDTTEMKMEETTLACKRNCSMTDKKTDFRVIGC